MEGEEIKFPIISWRVLKSNNNVHVILVDLTLNILVRTEVAEKEIYIMRDSIFSNCMYIGLRRHNKALILILLTVKQRPWNLMPVSDKVNLFG